MPRTIVALLWFLYVGMGIGFYTVNESFDPLNFFEKFDFFTADDPTHGFVDYVDKDEARSGGLISSTDTAVYIGVDYLHPVSTRGRKSVRISTKNAYDQMLVVLDLQHMPGEACGSWPAFWTVGSDWPNNGEIDIIEGVNQQAANRMALHTNSQCVLDHGGYTGTMVTSNCFVSASGQPSNAGCGISGSNGSFGAQFNRNGGGVYAMEWGSEDVKIWFFPRAHIPSDIAGRGQVDPQNWGIPTARFYGDCRVSASLGPQRLVFDITFCGDWAGSAWAQGDCGRLRPQCADYVATEPRVFQAEYWEINYLKVFSTAFSTSTATTSSPTSCA